MRVVSVYVFKNILKFDANGYKDKYYCIEHVVSATGKESVRLDSTCIVLLVSSGDFDSTKA